MDESIINKRVASYLITERINAGGVAIVYKAIDEANDDKVVAFKLLQTNWAEHEEVVGRFEREARIMQQLKHPHIVEFLDYGFHDHRPYIVMEYLPGGSLSAGLKRIAQISLGGSERLLAQMASALDYAHSKGVVHRDLKPGNILLRDDHHAALTDFGIARGGLEHTLLTNTGYMPGTPHYMSPEQARGETLLNHLSDQYSLAIIAYLLSTGGLPFTGTDPLVIINQHLSAQPMRPSEANPALPTALDDVLLRALSKKPSKRYNSVTEFVQAYADAIQNHRKLIITLNFARSKDSEDDQPAIDPDSRIFSSSAIPIFLPPEEAAILRRPRTLPPHPRLQQQQQQRRFRRMIISAVMVIFTLLVFGLLLFRGDNPFTGIGTDVTSTSTNTEAALVDTGTPTNTLTSTATPAPTSTASSTSTDTPTSTSTSTATATPSPTLTTTITPTVYARDLDGLLEDFEGAGTAARFNCQRFVIAYTFLTERLDAGDPEFEPARDLITGPDAPVSLIYEDYCQDEPENTNVAIIFTLYADMRSALEQIR